MAVADDAVKPAPPPPVRIVVALLALVRFVLAPMLERVFLVAGPALIYLALAIVWVLSAAEAASKIAGRACREGSAPLVFFEALSDAALKACIFIIFVFLAILALLMCGLCLAYVIAVVSGSGSELKKSAFGAIRCEPVQEFLKFPRAMVLGSVTNLAFILLSVVAGYLVMIMSPSVEGSISEGEMIGSVIEDVGAFCFHAICCLVIIPALALHFSREVRKAGLTVEEFVET